ncbi:hypothetical protein CHLRE_10g449138v5 [Chlamydomonas reinhardtii]|uniref:Uncharacterized protein n=1 Tax=Chlamydomonas reinhardtii TaxID=3055 RepID=A0A2K3DB20_CHLRE|nr:uncharacterized protein CHLRE_10g449138v5 [Chlamydomonas reinhardtii]PNW77730.1 hypothetical protein CHLRE_10g449138v5 [Chlamydomonas reinhardtii]
MVTYDQQLVALDVPAVRAFARWRRRANAVNPRYYTKLACIGLMIENLSVQHVTRAA